MEAFKEQETQTNQNNNEDDFCIIESIIESTGSPEENFSFDSMYMEYVQQLQQIFPAKGTMEMQPSHEGGDHKDGLHTVLFLMLQVVVMSKKNECDVELKKLWSTFANYSQTESGILQDNHIYRNLFYNVIRLATAFQNLPVSLLTYATCNPYC